MYLLNGKLQILDDLYRRASLHADPDGGRGQLQDTANRWRSTKDVPAVHQLDH